MKNRIIHKVILPALISLIPALCSVHAEGIVPDTLLTGKADTPVTVTVSEPSYRQIAQFDTDRMDNLNKVLKHLGISVTLDEDLSETTVTVDGETVFSYIETTGGPERKTVYSFDPDTAYICRDNASQQKVSEFADFLENQFFTINTLLDDLYPAFEKSAKAFAKYGKSSSISLNFRGYGKGVRQTTITLNAQYVSEKYHKTIAGLTNTEASRKLVERLVFNGPQKIMLLYDQDNHLLRIKYDGEAGFSKESMRNVSLTWRCVRTGKTKKDYLTLKTPAKKGYDKYNLIYERKISLPDDPEQKMAWDLQVDIKDSQAWKKISFTADLSMASKKINGSILYSLKQDSGTKSISIIPSMKKENSSDYTGTIEITNNSGKIISSSFTALVEIHPGNKPVAPADLNEYTADPQDSDIADAADPVQDRINSILVQRLLALPPEDLMFFSMDIPADIWNTLAQSF